MPSQTTPPPASQPTTFPLFTHLPPELRLKIWSLNLPPPRLIPLSYFSSTTPSSTFPSPPSSSIHLGCTAPTRIPSNLHTCSESRYHTLRHYNLHFNLPHCPGKIFFNPSIDIIHFGAREEYMGSFKHFINATTMIDPVELSAVTRLSVSEDLFHGCRRWRSTSVTQPCLRDFWSVVRAKFLNVEEVWIVPECDGGRYADGDVWTVEGWESRGNTGRGEATRNKLGRLHDGSRDKDGRLGSFYWEVLRAVAYVEERWGWEAPAWRVMRVPGEEDEMVVLEEKDVNVTLGKDGDLHAVWSDCEGRGFVTEFTGDLEWVSDDCWEWKV